MHGNITRGTSRIEGEDNTSKTNRACLKIILTVVSLDKNDQIIRDSLVSGSATRFHEQKQPKKNGTHSRLAVINGSC